MGTYLGDRIYLCTSTCIVSATLWISLDGVKGSHVFETNLILICISSMSSSVLYAKKETYLLIFRFLPVVQGPPLWSSGQSSLLRNRDVLCFL
jgi:hypothetical protein